MEPQLFLLPDTTTADQPTEGGESSAITYSPPVNRRLDQKTRDVGRQGIERARAALRRATRESASAAERSAA